MQLSEAALAEFASSLPATYRSAFSRDAMIRHCQLSQRRRGALAEVARFDAGDTEGQALCVVADDRPGLLAGICEALLLTGLEVTMARAFTRKLATPPNEAIDLFWVRPRVGRTLPDGDWVDRARALLLQVLQDADFNWPAALAMPRKPSSYVGTTVRFIDEDGSFSTLEVETGDRTGLLLAITLALTRNRVQIIGSLVNTRGALIFDRFQVRELDDSPIGAERRLEIQMAVLHAIDAAERSMAAE
jgi:[protein-PII] uridylyltransferase